jgi:hypothetical protein
MKKISLTNGDSGIYWKTIKAIGFVNKSPIFIASIFYVGHFVKFGIDFSQTNMPPLRHITPDIGCCYIRHDSFFRKSSTVAKSDTYAVVGAVRAGGDLFF